MKIKTSELQGIALDWAVAQIEGVKLSGASWKFQANNGGLSMPHRGKYNPSSNWSQGGPIIERERIEIDYAYEWGCWAAKAENRVFYLEGDTPLIAAMRCYVASKLGDEVEIPDTLMEDNIHVE